MVCEAIDRPLSGNFWEVQAEGIRPASLRQGNRPRLWLQSSVSSMCSRRASPGHAGALQVAGEAPHTKQNLGDNLLKSRLSLPHGPFTGKSTSVLPACSLGNTSPLPNALSRTVTLPQSPAFPCSPAHQTGPASYSLDPQGGRAHFGPSFLRSGCAGICLGPTHALANSSLKLRQGLAWPACTVSHRKAFRRKAFSCILEFPKLFPALVFLERAVYLPIVRLMYKSGYGLPCSSRSVLLYTAKPICS